MLDSSTRSYVEHYQRMAAMDAAMARDYRDRVAPTGEPLWAVGLACRYQRVAAEYARRARVLLGIEEG